MKIACAVLLLVAAGAIGMGFAAAPTAAQPAGAVPGVVMRSLSSSTAIVVGNPVAAGTEVARPKPDAVEPLKAQPKPAEVTPAPVAAQPKPAEAKPTAEARPVEAKPAPVAEPKAAPVAVRPAPVRPAPGAGAAQPATGGAPANEGSLNLRASDTADVYVDGKKVGGSPVLGHRVKAGKHKVRFDCYEPSGEAKPGIVQTVEVATEAERDVEYECPSN